MCCFNTAKADKCLYVCSCGFASLGEVFLLGLEKVLGKDFFRKLALCDYFNHNAAFKAHWLCLLF